jgi:hypothetical protein
MLDGARCSVRGTEGIVSGGTIMVADGRTVDSEENKNLLRQYHFRTDIFVSSTSEEAAREKARAELDTEQGVKLVLEDVLDLPEYRKEDDELITLPLPRREVAAIILYHLEVVDSYYSVVSRIFCTNVSPSQKNVYGKSDSLYIHGFDKFAIEERPTKDHRIVS